jgi:hypothetical protein
MPGSNVLHTSYRADEFVDAVHRSSALEDVAALTVRSDGEAPPRQSCMASDGLSDGHSVRACGVSVGTCVQMCDRVRSEIQQVSNVRERMQLNRCIHGCRSRAQETRICASKMTRVSTSDESSLCKEYICMFLAKNWSVFTCDRVGATQWQTQAVTVQYMLPLANVVQKQSLLGHKIRSK